MVSEKLQWIMFLFFTIIVVCYCYYIDDMLYTIIFSVHISLILLVLSTMTKSHIYKNIKNKYPDAIIHKSFDPTMYEINIPFKTSDKNCILWEKIVEEEEIFYILKFRKGKNVVKSIYDKRNNIVFRDYDNIKEVIFDYPNHYLEESKIDIIPNVIIPFETNDKKCIEYVPIGTYMKPKENVKYNLYCAYFFEGNYVPKSMYLK